MQLNVVYDSFALAAPQSFRDGIAAAAAILNAAIRDNIVVNIAVGYGEFGGQALPDQNTSEGDIGFTGDGTEGLGVFESYSALRAQLTAHATSADDASSVGALPTSSVLQGQSNFIIGTAQAKALWVIPAAAGAIDGQIGIGKNFTGSVLIAGALHEITHAMGRVVGTSLDLFRYNGPGTHVFGFTVPSPSAYFSVDGGTTDLADFGLVSDPSDFLNLPASNRTPGDPFNETVGGTAALTSIDLRIMDVLGFNVGAAAPAPNIPFDFNWVLVGIGDFNGDRKADLAWQRASDNLVEIQLLNGSTSIGGGVIANSPFDASWNVVASDDFNGDGESDLVYRRIPDGLTEIQLLNGNQAIGGGAISNNPFDFGWTIITTGDFNADAHADLLWRRNSDGLPEIQFLNGSTAIGGGAIANNPFDANWNVVARGDFNGDGRTDLVWRHNTDGLVEIQLLNGLVGIGGGPIINNVFDATWNVVAAGDFLGNGKSDLVWQHTSDGLVEIQFLNGAVAVGGGLIANNPFGLGWRVVGAADSNGDGKPDLVYRRISDGLTELDLLNGTTIIGGGIAGARLDPNQTDTPAVTGLQRAPGDTSSGTQNTLAMPQNGEDNLNLIYQQVLGREPDSGGLATYQALLDSGADLGNVRSIIAHSAEAQLDLVRLFGGILNRDPNAAELMGAENRLADGASLQDLQDGLITDGGAGGFTIVGVPNGDTTVASASGPTAFLCSDVNLGRDTVLGFDTTEDTLVLGHSQLLDFSAVLAHASAVDGGTLITFGPTQSVLMSGVSLPDLQSHNFQFV